MSGDENPWPAVPAPMGMYAGGVEVANCYDEERDADTVRNYYRKAYAELIRRRNSTETVIPDIDLLSPIASMSDSRNVPASPWEWTGF
jgi:elongation factor P--beta-lysine ligase